MKNNVTLTGRLPMFDAKYYPSNGEKKSMINWGLNVQIDSKNDQGYYDEALINFTAWGFVADELNRIASLPKDDATRKEYQTVTVTGKLIAGYKDKDGNMINQCSLNVSEFEFIKRLPRAEEGSETAAPVARPQTTRPGAPTAAPRTAPAPTAAPRPAQAPKTPAAPRF